MKKVIIALVIFTAVGIVAPGSAMAQQKKSTSAQTLLDNLSQVSLQGGLINVGNVSVDVHQVNVQDLVTVQNVLNNANIEIIKNSLNNNDVLKNISVDLTNLLRDAKILNSNQIVVGILSDQNTLRFVTANRRAIMK